jgi:hypothetical protein
MGKFPFDAPNRKVVKALQSLGFRLVREGNPIAMERKNPDGTFTPLTMPNHPTIKGSTLQDRPDSGGNIPKRIPESVFRSIIRERRVGTTRRHFRHFRDRL